MKSVYATGNYVETCVKHSECQPLRIQAINAMSLLIKHNGSQNVFTTFLSCNEIMSTFC